jgi:hypothetical protein
LSGHEKRLHRRIGGIVAQHATVRFPGGRIYHLNNISYGGFSIKLALNSADDFVEGTSHQVTMKILGQSVDTEVRVANIFGNQAGFAIEHSGIDALIFLRGIFEFWQNGASARLVDSDRSKAVPADANRLYVNGDGPTDMLLTLKPAGQPPNVMITFMSDGDYSQVEFTNGTIKTGKAFGESKMPGSSIRMDSEVDTRAVRQAICLLAGIDISPIRNEIDQILTIWINFIG